MQLIVVLAPNPRIPQIRLDQPRTLGRLALPAKHQHHPAVGQQPHVSAHPQRTGRRDADAEQITVARIRFKVWWCSSATCLAFR
jgi:hypothetical protein